MRRNAYVPAAAMILLLAGGAGSAWSAETESVKALAAKVEKKLLNNAKQDEKCARASAYANLMRAGKDAQEVSDAMIAILNNEDRQHEWPWAAGVLYYAYAGDSAALTKIVDEKLTGDALAETKANILTAVKVLSPKQLKPDGDLGDFMGNHPQFCYLNLEKLFGSREEEFQYYSAEGFSKLDSVPEEGAKIAAAAIGKVKRADIKEMLYRGMGNAPWEYREKFLDVALKNPEQGYPYKSDYLDAMVADDDRGVPLLLTKLNDQTWLAKDQNNVRTEIFNRLIERPGMRARMLPVIAKLGEVEKDVNLRFAIKEQWCKYVKYHPDPVEALPEKVTPEIVEGCRKFLAEKGMSDAYRMSAGYAMMELGELPPDVEVLFKHRKWPEAWKVLATNETPEAHAALIKVYLASAAPRQAEIAKVVEDLDYKSEAFCSLAIGADKNLCIAAFRSLKKQEGSEDLEKAIAARLSDPDPNVRLAVMEGLVSLYTSRETGGSVYFPGDVEANARLLATDTDPRVRRRLLDLLFELGSNGNDYVAVIVADAITDTAPEVRLEACGVLRQMWIRDDFQILAAIGKARLQQVVTAAYYDPDPKVKSEGEALWAKMFPSAPPPIAAMAAPGSPAATSAAVAAGSKKMMLLMIVVGALAVAGAIVAIIVIAAGRSKRPPGYAGPPAPR